MNCFLIDFENVRSSGLKGIEHLTNIDDVCIFYSDYANSITFDIHHSMNRSSANITFFKSTKTGKNALDFQLVSYLGYLIAQKKYKNYYVITGDRGFESAISFWKDFFKENKMNYLNIGRFYTIKDALDKKNFPIKTIKDTLPTIPTVESELELRQLKAESIIVDIPSNKVEKRIENSLNIDEKKSSNVNNNSLKSTINVESKSKQDDKTVVNTSQMETIRKPFENLKNVASKKDKELNSKNTSNTINKSIEDVNNILDVNKSSTPIKDNKKSQSKNTSNNHKQTHSKEESKFKNKNSKVNKQSVNGNKFNNNSVQSSDNVSKKGNNTSNGNGNVQNKFNNNNKLLNNTNVPKLNYSEPVKLPSQTTKSTNDGSLFGKINPNDASKVVEKFEKKLPQTSQSQNVDNKIEPPKKTITPPPVTDLVENIKSKELSQKVTSKDKEDISKSKKEGTNKSINQAHIKQDTQKEFKAKSSIESTKSVKDVKEKEIKSVIIEEKIQNVETKVDTSQIKKSKRGRPRTKSIEETLKTENNKPKNNKKFQKDIPQDKLSKMMDELIKLPTISKYSKEDLTTICKVIAFGTKNESYRAFMSLLGKQKALESYHIIKPHFDDLKKLFES